MSSCPFCHFQRSSTLPSCLARRPESSDSASISAGASSFIGSSLLEWVNYRRWLAGCVTFLLLHVSPLRRRPSISQRVHRLRADGFHLFAGRIQPGADAEASDRAGQSRRGVPFSSYRRNQGQRLDGPLGGGDPPRSGLSYGALQISSSRG